MNGPDRHGPGHLGPEELERIALGEDVSPGAVAHVSDCAACRREVEGVRRLHAGLLALETSAPAPGFADRVMARVRLPEPAWLRALRTIRERPARALPALAGLLLTLGGAVSWRVAYPEIT
ncbi:MAG: hypothetical protein RRA92_08845, partial [Gemmatimonadota bacterium]|nr:hypothetical protein [Gemmatimonadota bacterium]